MSDIRRVVVDVDTTGRHPLLNLDPIGIARLARPDREKRVALLVDESHAFLARGRRDLVDADGKRLAATAVLFSGGNDSTTLAHLFRDHWQYAIHANTGIGIEATRQFVRDTCAAWGKPLIEKHPPAGSTYRDLVLAQGFPGPAKHWLMFSRLKERAIHAARNDLITNNRRERVIYLAGRRRDESERRADVPILERHRTIVYVSPLALWTKLDLNTYRLMAGDVPRNPVADTLHMSGECLCGAFAHRGELDEIGTWHPEVRAQVEALEREVRAAWERGEVVECKGKRKGQPVPEEWLRWGWGADREKPSRRSGVLCASCPPPLPLVLVDEHGRELTNLNGKAAA